VIRTTNGYDVNYIEQVELIDWMGNDNAVCDAARVSFHKEASGYTTYQNAKLLDYLAKHDHCGTKCLDAMSMSRLGSTSLTHGGNAPTT
jgi:hypothetical protein